MKQTFEIIHIVSDPDLIIYQEKLKQYCEGKKILKKREGASAIVIPGGGSVGIMLVPYCYIVHEATQNEFNTWKFNQKIMNT